MKSQHDQNIISYLKELRASLTFGRCAGKITEITKLHQNQLISDDYRIFQYMKFHDMCFNIARANVSKTDREPVDRILAELLSRILNFEAQNLEEYEGDDVFHPYWYSNYFNLEEERYHHYEDDEGMGNFGEIILPSISEDQRGAAIEYVDKALEQGFSEFLTIKVLQVIQKGASQIREHINTNMRNIDDETNLKFVSKEQVLDEDISELQRLLDEAEENYAEFRLYIDNYPKGLDISEHEQHMFDRKESLLMNRRDQIKIDLERVQTQKQALNKEMEQFKNRMISQLKSEDRIFLELMPTSKSSLFGNIPTFINSIIKGEQTLSNELENLENGGLISVYGDPGFGKTIQLRQFTHRLTSAQLAKSGNLKIPIYVKAKALSRNIQLMEKTQNEGKESNITKPAFLGNFEEYMSGLRKVDSQLKRRQKDKPFNPFASNAAQERQRIRNSKRGAFPQTQELLFPETWKTMSSKDMQVFVKSIIDTEPEMEENIVYSLFGKEKIGWDDIYLIIDAYDEILLREDRAKLISFTCEKIIENKCPIIITCRNSHKSEIITQLEKGDNINSNEELKSITHKMMKIHFTKEELQYTMPTKLANAWGIDSDQISHSAAVEFQQYEEVLTHPLFVGFFCMLLSHNALTDTDSKNPFFTTRLDHKNNVHKKQPMELEGSISLQHVVFLRKVIEFGLEINIEEREGINPNEVEKIRRIFCYIAATFLTTGLSNLDHILRFIKKYHRITVSNKEKKILNENLGVMFVNGEKEIEWTHKTLPEIATGLLILEDQKYHNYLIKEYGSLFGNFSNLWSECLLMTLIQDDLENFSTTKGFEKLRSLFPSMGTVALERTLAMFGVEDKNYISNVKYIEEGGYNYTVGGNPTTNRVITALAVAYFASLSKGTPFPIPNSLLGNSLTKEFLKHVFKRSNMKNGIYSDIVTQPLLLQLPNLPIDEVFNRFENDVPELLSFFFKRKLLNPKRSIHPNQQLEDDFVVNLINAIDQLPTAFDLDPIVKGSGWKWGEVIYSSLQRKKSLDLMNSVCKRINNSWSEIKIKEITQESLDQIDKNLFLKINSVQPQNAKTTKQKNVFKNKIKSKYLREVYPHVFKQIIGLILSWNHPDWFWDPHSRGRESREKIRQLWGLPEYRWASVAEAFDENLPTSRMGDFDLIPKWIPTNVYIDWTAPSDKGE
mgnify:CR=1 FL=1